MAPIENNYRNDDDVRYLHQRLSEHLVNPTLEQIIANQPLSQPQKQRSRTTSKNRSPTTMAPKSSRLIRQVFIQDSQGTPESDRSISPIHYYAAEPYIPDTMNTEQKISPGHNSRTPNTISPQSGSDSDENEMQGTSLPMMNDLVHDQQLQILQQQYQDQLQHHRNSHAPTGVPVNNGKRHNSKQFGQHLRQSSTPHNHHFQFPQQQQQQHQQRPQHQQIQLLTSQSRHGSVTKLPRQASLQVSNGPNMQPRRSVPALKKFQSHPLSRQPSLVPNKLSENSLSNYYINPMDPQTNIVGGQTSLAAPEIRIVNPSVYSSGSRANLHYSNDSSGHLTPQMSLDENKILLEVPDVGGFGDGTESPKVSISDNILAPFKCGSHHLGGAVPNIVTINVAGKRFETTYETLMRYPNSMLGKPELRDRHWNPETQEYFFDRNRSAFGAILFMYQSNGYLLRPSKVPLEVFHQELRYYKMPPEVMEKFWRNEGFRLKKPKKLPENDAMRRLWLFMEDPNSSTAARILAIISTLVIVTACVAFIIETVPGILHSDHPLNSSSIPENISSEFATADLIHHQVDHVTKARDHSTNNPFHVIELICISFFTVELFLRFISSPSKRQFFHEMLNIIDVIAIAPFYITMIFPQTRYSEVSMGFAVLRVVRLLHIFHIMKISKYSRGITTLGLTFKAGFREMLLLVFVVVLLDILFACGIYLAEYTQDKTLFRSIPDALWYGIITMTTVGYGDMIPNTTLGRIIGSLCAVTGLMVISLPIPVIVKNFKHFYRQEYQVRHVNDLIVKDHEKVTLVVCGDNWLKR